MEIRPVPNVGFDVQSPLKLSGHAAESPENFGQVLLNIMGNTNSQMNAADQALSAFSSGEANDIEQVVLATAKADISFRFFLEMRNKLTESYQELSRMQF